MASYSLAALADFFSSIQPTPNARAFIMEKGGYPHYYATALLVGCSSSHCRSATIILPILRLNSIDNLRYLIATNHGKIATSSGGTSKRSVQDDSTCQQGTADSSRIDATTVDDGTVSAAAQFVKAAGIAPGRYPYIL